MEGGFARSPITVAKDQPVKSEAGSETKSPSERDGAAAEQCKQQQQDVVAAPATSEVNCAHLPANDEIDSVFHGVKRERADMENLESVASVSIPHQAEPVTSAPSASSAPSMSLMPSMSFIVSMHWAMTELLHISRIEKQRIDACQKMFIDSGDGDDAVKAHERAVLQGVSQGLDTRLARVYELLAQKDPANGV